MKQRKSFFRELMFETLPTIFGAFALLALILGSLMWLFDPSSRQEIESYSVVAFLKNIGLATLLAPVLTIGGALLIAGPVYVLWRGYKAIRSIWEWKK